MKISSSKLTLGMQPVKGFNVGCNLKDDPYHMGTILDRKNWFENFAKFHI